MHRRTGGAQALAIGAALVVITAVPGAKARADTGPTRSTTTTTAAPPGTTTPTTLATAPPTTTTQARPPVTTSPPATTSPPGATTTSPRAAVAVQALPPPARVVSYSITTDGPVVSDVRELDAIVAATYADPRGWGAASIGFQRLASGGDYTIVLASPDRVPAYAPGVCDTVYSCQSGRFVVINDARWAYGSPNWPGPLAAYRQMVVNHETGHWLGLGHASCPGPGQLAPVMQQQSIDMQGCAVNPWPLGWELDLVAPVPRLPAPPPATSVGYRHSDVDGDGTSDLVAWNRNEVGVKLSTGAQFAPTTLWNRDEPFYGDKADVIGDVDGDGTADLVAWNGATSSVIGVKLSTGSSFAPTRVWRDEAFYGSVADLVGDVDGDGTADLVAWNERVVGVKRSTGSSFGATELWVVDEPFYGDEANLLADVNGDGRADLVAWNGVTSAVVGVKLSTGSSFGPTQVWNGERFYGEKADLLADVNGDGRADLVAWNGSNLGVKPSSGAGFGPTQMWIPDEAYSGDVADLLGDATGDGKADALAWNGTGSTVVGIKRSTGAQFGPTEMWSTDRYYGDRASVFG